MNSSVSTSKKKVKYAESLDNVKMNRYQAKLELISGEVP